MKRLEQMFGIQIVEPSPTILSLCYVALLRSGLRAHCECPVLH